MKKTLRLALALVLTVAILATGLIFANAAATTVTDAAGLDAAIKDDSITEIVINTEIVAGSKLGGYNNATKTFTGTGKVVFNGSGDTGMHIYGGCNFVFDGPSFELADTNTTSRLIVGYDASNAVNITIKQGNFVGEIEVQQSTVLNVEGGTFTSKADSTKGQNSIELRGNGKVNISGGVFNASAGNCVQNTAVDCELNVTGGTFNVTGEAKAFAISNNCKVHPTNVSGITINADGTANVIRAEEGITFNLSNATVNHTGSGYLFDAIGTVNVAGGTYTLPDATKFVSEEQKAQVKVTGGTFNFDPTAYVNTNDYEVTAGTGTWTVDVPKTSFTVSFDGQGAANPADATTNVQGTLSTLPTVSKDGYVFQGWFDAATGGNKITTETVFTADTTVYAQWTVYVPTTWEVTDFDTWNDAITNCANNDIIHVTGEITDTARRTIEGKKVTFTGDGIITFDNASAQTGLLVQHKANVILDGPAFISTQANSADRLLVVWGDNADKTATVTINAGIFIGEIQVQHDGALVVNGGDFYNGSGKNDKKDIIEVQDRASLVVNGGTFVVDIGASSAINAQNSDTTISNATFEVGNCSDSYAIQLQNNQHTITNCTFINEGVSRAIHVRKNVTGVVEVSDSTFTHSGSNFSIGFWSPGTLKLTNVTATHTGTDDRPHVLGMGDADGTAILNGCNFTAELAAVKLNDHNVVINAEGAVSTLTSKTTDAILDATGGTATVNKNDLLVLNNEANKVAITFDAQGATNPESVKTDLDGKLAELPAVSKVGSIFNGWFDAATGGNKVTVDTVFTKATTLYAQWTVCDHKASTAQPNCKNGATCSICGFQMPAGEHNNVWKYDANQHWQECSGCGTVAGQKVNHSGGTATCSTKAVCAEANCAQAYGEFDAANHESTEFTYVENADGTTHTKKNACCGAVAVADEAHDFGDDVICDYCEYTKGYKVTEGDAQSVEEGKDATFKIDADFSKFTNAVVKVDGTVVAAENYTAVEGSIVITLKASYLETLDAGNHTLEVTLADGGVATTAFTTAKAGGAGNEGGNTEQKPAPNPGTQTGDFTNITLLFVLAMLSGLAMTALTVRAKKRA